ncbi:hypothetical protein ABW19_dt0209974 [Dactylella cylindrospora]|nr:hypothetical protein ABW19_dt0209974 [Dactylella cylindrospora]
MSNNNEYTAGEMEAAGGLLGLSEDQPQDSNQQQPSAGTQPSNNNSQQGQPASGSGPGAGPNPITPSGAASGRKGKKSSQPVQIPKFKGG